MAKSVLNLHRDPIITLLPWIMAMAAVVFSFSVIGCIAALQNSSWGNDLARDEAVVVVPWQADKLSQKERINRVVELIIETPGLSDASIMTETEQQTLLKPWLGDELNSRSTEPLALTIPTLVKLKVAANSQLETFQLQLSKVVSDAQLVMNQQGRDQARRLNATVLSLLALVLILSLVGMLLVIVFAVKILLRSQADTIETLQQLGATRGFIHKQFQSISLRIGLSGGVLAGIFVLVIGLILWLALPEGTLARFWFENSLVAFPISILGTCLVASGIAFAGTKYSLLQTLKNLENLNKI